MNLLIIPSWYPSKGNPGNGIFFREQAVALSKAGYRVTVIDVSFHGRTDTFNPNNFKFTYLNDEGVHTYTLKIPSFYILSRMSKVYVAIYKSLLFRAIKKVFRKGEKFDVIHAHSFYPAGYCAGILAQKYNIPLVVTEHSSAVLNYDLSANAKKQLAFTIENCHEFICVSEALKNSIQSQITLNKDLRVIPNMYAPIFNYNETISDSKEFIFLSVGNLIESKRHLFTIHCFEKAFEGNKNVKLQIAGNGPLYHSIKMELENRKLTEKIQLLGWINKKNLAEKLKECNIFVLASVIETFGIVYVEAMACGKPIIAVKNGGANDLINETNGILIEPDNEKELIEAFRYMYANANLYDHKQIAGSCAEKYSEESVVLMLSKIYKKVTIKDEV